MIFWQLFLSFFQIGILSIGGGYASLPIIQDQVVSIHHWLTMQEYADVLTISQMTPGPIAINAASFVGIKVAGILGAITATIGVVLPSFMIVLTLSFIYYKYRGLSWLNAILKGLRPAVVALIASAGLTLVKQALWLGGEMTFSSIHMESLILFLFAFLILRKYKTDPIKIMFLCGCIALGISFLPMGI